MVAPYKLTKRNGYGFAMRTCDICPKEFMPKSMWHIHCSKRCAYIAVKLSRKAAKDMDRDVAIAFYGSQYADPLRHIVRGNVRSLIRLIMTFCEANSTILVSRQELEEYSGAKVKPLALSVAAKNVSALTYFAKELMDDGSTREMYQFLVEDLVSNADARARNVGSRRYRRR